MEGRRRSTEESVEAVRVVKIIQPAAGHDNQDAQRMAQWHRRFHGRHGTYASRDDGMSAPVAVAGGLCGSCRRWFSCRRTNSGGASTGRRPMSATMQQCDLREGGEHFATRDPRRLWRGPYAGNGRRLTDEIRSTWPKSTTRVSP